MDQQKIAYLVLAHADPQQLERLVHAINYQCDIFIHIDGFASLEPFSKLQMPENVTFVQSRAKVNWGGYSIVRATLKLIETAIATGVPYSHFVLLSGMDYPIKRPNEFIKYLQSQPNKQFIRYQDMRTLPKNMFRIERYFFRDIVSSVNNRQIRRVLRTIAENLVKFKKRTYLKDVTPCFGSQWWALSYDCVQYIQRYIQQNPAFVKFYKNTFAPDEHFFHTIVGNSAYASQVPQPEGTLGEGPYDFANFHIVHPSLQKVYTEADFEEIKSSDKFFVRKVNSSLSKNLLKRIDTMLLQKQSSPMMAHPDVKPQESSC